MDKTFLKVVYSELIRIATFPFRLMPIRKNRILFTGLTGGNSYDYSCNPKYIYEYMRDNYKGKFEMVWAVADPEKYAFLQDEGVKLVKHFTISSYPLLLTSKVVITNGSYAPWFPFRKKQYVINTWHGGGAYKKVENERPDANWATKRRARFCADNIDLFLASCRIQEEQMIRTTYQYEKEVLRAGTPRNDKLICGDTGKMADKVREYYKIPQDAGIVLYAPTYRNGETEVVMDSDKLLVLLEQGIAPVYSDRNRKQKKWYFLSRYHRYQDDSMNVKVIGNNILNAADYPDMQELLCAADILITDYSSCVWDFGFLYRPCFLYVPDREEYTAKTGYYVNLEEWPYLQALTMEELAENIKRYDPAIARESQRKHYEQLGSYETGQCRERIAEKICAECQVDGH